MAPEGITRFRLSIWRPAQPGRQLDYASTGGSAVAIGTAAFDIARLQEEIYHWHQQEDVWGCIETKSISIELRELFVEGFAPNLSPEQRSMAQFRSAVERLNVALSDDAVSTWADTMQSVITRRQERVNLRANIAIAFLNHMEWVLRTFGNVPGASVTIR